MNIRPMGPFHPAQIATIKRLMGITPAAADLKIEREYSVPVKESVAIFQGLNVPCCMGNEGCICGDEERVLRAYKNRLFGLPPMTQLQREWCLNEIGSVEGYTRSEWVDHDDDLLASGVLSAWTDYCRDKGLL